MSQGYKKIAGVFLLVLAVFAGSCGPQVGKNSSPKSKTRIPQPTPIFYPEGAGPFPAILLLPPAVHEISADKTIAGNLAAQGYVVRVVDYGDRKFTGMFKDTARMDDFKRLASENLASLKAQPRVDPSRIGVMGYSLGGFFVTYLASKPDETGLRAGVIYYGTYDVPDHIKKLRVPILAFQGEEDQMSEFVRNAAAMKQVAMDWKKQFELVFYPQARHGFDRMIRSPYQRVVAENSWARMLGFMDAHLKRN